MPDRLVEALMQRPGGASQARQQGARPLDGGIACSQQGRRGHTLREQSSGSGIVRRSVALAPPRTQVRPGSGRNPVQALSVRGN
eukprot:13329336-Alexandrium_andersonii.AAC.1